MTRNSICNYFRRDTPHRNGFSPVTNHRFIDARQRFTYCTVMAKKKNTKKLEKKAFLGNLDHLGGKKLMQHGAEDFSKAKESRKHSVGGGKRG